MSFPSQRVVQLLIPTQAIPKTKVENSTFEKKMKQMIEKQQTVGCLQSSSGDNVFLAEETIAWIKSLTQSKIII